MRHQVQVFFVVVGFIVSTRSMAQESFSSCSAAFIGPKMIVSEYSPNGQCRMLATETGELTVQTVALSPTGSKAIDKIEFKVAIRDRATGTLMMYSGETFRQVPVQQVLAKCKKGDHIVLLTMDNQYALPHNEILVLQ